MSQENNEIKEENVDNILNLLSTEQIISYISNDIVTILIENREKQKTNIIYLIHWLNL